MSTPEEEAIQGVIDQIWDTYDVDRSGELDKDETKKFVKDTLGNLSGGDEFSDEAFDEVFSTFDKDGKAILPPLQFKSVGDYSLVLSKPSADSAKGSAPLNQTGSLLVAVS